MSQTPLALSPRSAPWDGAEGMLAEGLWPQRVRDLVALTKPRIAALSLLTVAAGFVLGGGPGFDVTALGHLLVGAAAVAAGAGALNQAMERRGDAQMARTANRPLPAGRMPAAVAVLLGSLLAGGGVAYLAVSMNGPTAGIALAIAGSYLAVYTPLKRRSTLNTVFGAVSGALPPVMGWAAARGTIDPEAGVLFLILFLWQFPHFLAIAWIYRHDYQRAGMRMLSTVDETGALTAYHALGYCLALVPVSLIPSVFGDAGSGYFVCAGLLGLWLLGFTIRFVRSRDHARGLLHASLIYLPLLLGALCVQRLVPASAPPSGAPLLAARLSSHAVAGPVAAPSLQP